MKVGITCYPTYGGSGIVATELGLELANRGADFVVTRNVRALGEAMRAHAAARAAPAASMATANAVSRAERISRAEVLKRATRANGESVIRPDVRPRANLSVRTDTGPRVTADADTYTYTYTDIDNDDESHRITMAAEA